MSRKLVSKQTYPLLFPHNAARLVQRDSSWCRHTVETCWDTLDHTWIRTKSKPGHFSCWSLVKMKEKCSLKNTLLSFVRNNLCKIRGKCYYLIANKVPAHPTPLQKLERNSYDSMHIKILTHTVVRCHKRRSVSLSQNCVRKCEFWFNGQSRWKDPDERHTAVDDKVRNRPKTEGAFQGTLGGRRLVDLNSRWVAWGWELHAPRYFKIGQENLKCASWNVRDE